MGLATIDPHSQKEHTEIHKIPNLVLVFTEIQAFKNVKIYKEMYGHPDTDGHTISQISSESFDRISNPSDNADNSLKNFE